jgi:hypothetical protein
VIYPVLSTSINNATVRGGITAMNDYTNVSYYFFLKKHSDLSWLASTEFEYAQSTGIYSYTYTGLDDNTQYDAMFCVRGTEHDFIEEQCLNTTFYTLEYIFSPPVVRTLNADPGSTTAYLFGDISDMGDTSNVSTFFRWKKTTDGLWTESFTKVTRYGTATFQEQITGLNDSTSYQYVACGSYYDDSLALQQTCGSIKYFYTISLNFDGIVFDTFDPYYITHSQADFGGEISDMNGVSSIYYYFRYKDIDASEWIYTTQQTASYPMSVTYDMSAGALVPSTTYEVQLCIEDISNADIRCDDSIYFNTLEYGIYNPPVIVSGDNTFDDIWLSVFEGSVVSQYLAGFFIMMAVLFIGISVFGSFHVQMGAFGIMALIFLGIFLATILGLFPIYILILILVGIIVLMILKRIAFPGESGG